MGDTTVESKTEIPEATPQELMLQAQSVELINEFMRQSGYDMQRSEVYKNPAKVSEYENRLGDIDKQIASLEAQKIGQLNTAHIDLQIGNLAREKADVNTKLSDEKSNVTYEYKAELNERGKKLRDMEDKALDRQAEMQDKFYKLAKDFVDGKVGMSDEQKQYIQDSLKNMREPIFGFIDALDEEYKRTGESINVALDDLQNVIKDTGISVGAAINAVSDKINLTKQGVETGLAGEAAKLAETGSSVRAALMGVKDEIANTDGNAKAEMERLFGIRRAMADQGMTDRYNEMVSRNASMAASQGRSQFDPQFQKQLQDNLMKDIKMTNLSLSEQESLLALGLAKETGGKLEAVAYDEARLAESLGMRAEDLAAKQTALEESTGMRQEALAGEQAAFAERQGQKMEGVAGQRAAVAERTGAGLEAGAQARLGTEEALQQYGQGLRDQFAINFPAQAVGMGTQVAGYQSALRQQGLANTQAASGAGLNQQQLMLQERMAQPTTTQTTSGSIFGTIMGGLGAGASAFSGVAGGVGALQGASALRGILGGGAQAAGNYTIPAVPEFKTSF